MLGYSAFADCSSLIGIELSNNLEAICYGLFNGCTLLESLEIPGSVRELSQHGNYWPSDTFGECSNLSKLRLLYSTENLIVGYGEYGHLESGIWGNWTNTLRELYVDRNFTRYIPVPNLEKLEIGRHMQTVPVDNINELQNLNTIKCNALVPPELPEMTNVQYMNINVYVPEESLEAYKADPVWGKFWNISELPEIKAEQIILSEDNIQLEVGAHTILTATVLPEDATYNIVTWTSSDENIVTVDNEGNVSAHSVGEAVVTATCGEVSASCVVTVTPILAESLTISPDSWSGEEGESFIIEVTILPDNTTDKTLLFESDDESVAIVDQEGKVSVLTEGTCIITVSTVDGSNLTSKCFITGLAGIDLVNNDYEKTIIGSYDISGNPVDELFKGFVIVHFSDGSTKKIMQ